MSWFNGRGVDDSLLFFFLLLVLLFCCPGNFGCRDDECGMCEATSHC